MLSASLSGPSSPDLRHLDASTPASLPRASVPQIRRTYKQHSAGRSGHGERDQRTCRCTGAAAADGASSQPDKPQAGRAGPENASSSIPPVKPSAPLGHVKRFFFGDKLDKERMKQLGMGAVASYGFVSNVTYGGGMAVAWIGFVRQFGKSPLMPGQWKAFLAFYAGYWTLQNFVRPLRFSLALVMAPAFDNFMNMLSSRLRISKRNAFGIYLFILGTATSVLVFGSIRILAGPLAYARQ